jgi:hypothetical protein
MTGSGFNYTYWDSGFLRLFDEASSRGFEWNKDIIQSLFDAEECALALDELAAAYLNNAKQFPSDILNLFDDLATRIGIVDGDEYDSVAELRALPRQP